MVGNLLVNCVLQGMMNGQMAAWILPLSLCAEVSNLEQSTSHAFAQAQAQGAFCGVEGSPLQQEDCRQ